ncbi:MAG: NUDIX domain-containing protein [Cucumibacter sp.]
MSAAVSIAVWNGEEVLLVRRRRPPFEDCWSVPGGRIEDGETRQDAVARELFEETGLRVDEARFVKNLGTEVAAAGYAIAVYAALYAGGEPKAGTDAAALGWFVPEEIAGLETTPGLEEIIAITRAALAGE